MSEGKRACALAKGGSASKSREKGKGFTSQHVCIEESSQARSILRLFVDEEAKHTSALQNGRAAREANTERLCF